MKIKDKVIAEIELISKDGIEIIQILQGKFPKDKDSKFLFHQKYQIWYTKALSIVKLLAPDRFSDFTGYYKKDLRRKILSYETYVIEDYIVSLVPSIYRCPDFDGQAQALNLFYNQWNILISIKQRAVSVLQDVHDQMESEILDSHIETAFKLLKINPRLAGSLPGVLLEEHLQKIAVSRGVDINKKDPSISDLNDPLKAAGIYGIPEWRKISYLADIRNLCSHKKSADPTPQQVQELLDGVKWALKNI